MNKHRYFYFSKDCVYFYHLWLFLCFFFLSFADGWKSGRSIWGNSSSFYSQDRLKFTHFYRKIWEESQGLTALDVWLWWASISQLCRFCRCSSVCIPGEGHSVFFFFFLSVNSGHRQTDRQSTLSSHMHAGWLAPGLSQAHPQIYWRTHSRM